MIFEKNLKSKKFSKTTTAIFLSAMFSTSFSSYASSEQNVAGVNTSHISKPNVIVILTDDQGYGDLGTYGATDIKTPNLDQMADEGVKFTNFYASSPVCTPSRAGLLTGSYPKRVSIANKLFFPNEQAGLNPEEVTIADMLKEEDYNTLALGKWHLGRPDEVLPTKQGFDHYFGIPYSNDMTPDHPAQLKLGGPWPKLPLMEDETVIDDGTDDPDNYGVDQTNLTKIYTERAVEFIKNNNDEPFFLYLAHSQPHYPNFSSAAWQGTSERGRYGDAVQEIDWSVGEIISTLKTYNLDKNTLVIFTSDNGPWKKIKDMPKDAMGHWSIWSDGTTGNALPLDGWKAETYEGGQRVPAIVRWPGVIPSGMTTDELSSNLDILPTIADYADIDLSNNPTIDGKSIRALLEDPQNEESPNDYFLYYDIQGQTLRAIRNSAGYKLQIYDENIGKNNLNNTVKVNRLYFMPDDIHTDHDISSEHPEIVKELLNAAETIDNEITNNQRPEWRG